MLFSIALYLSLFLFLLGLILKLRNWITIKIGEDAANLSSGERIKAAAVALAASLSGPRLSQIFKAFLGDVILQLPLLRDHRLRWLMHVAIYWGFVLLLLMHALEELVTRPLFPEFASTLNPFLFLRNLFGVMVILGIVVAVYRRIRLRGYRLPSGWSDALAILLIALIVFSGFALEAFKISSPSRFRQMVDEYAALEGDEDLQALKHYWGAKFGVVFPEGQITAGGDVMEKGRGLHEENCAACHSRPGWAFVSYPLSRVIKTAVPSLERSGALNWLWALHFLFCFLGLALLPFTKFFHILSSPLHLMIRALSGGKNPHPANAVTLRAMALDACTHCGTCSSRCSVAPVFQKLMNRNILPSEKLLSLKALTGRGIFPPEAMRALQEGSYLCTGCYRCTLVCPVGINLQDLWSASKEDLHSRGYPEPHVWVRDKNRGEWKGEIMDRAETLDPDQALAGDVTALSSQAETFSACFECQTCTTVCPVVANYEDPAGTLDLLPHQIMHALGLGFREESLSSRMVWDCLTCYLCQEQCPQGVRVTDVLYELKNRAYDRACRKAGTGYPEEVRP